MPAEPTSALERELINEEEHRYSPVDDERVAEFLTPKRLADLLKQADGGDVRAYLTFAEELERRDLHYRAAITQRKSAVSQLMPEVEPVSGSARNERVARDVRALFEADTFRQLLFDLLDAVSKGFSVVEIMWAHTERSWFPREYKWRRQKLFRVHPVSLRSYRLDDYSYEGAALPEHKFVVHEANLCSGPAIQSGLARVCAPAYLCKSYSVQDLMTFQQVYGIPARLGRYPDGATPQYRSKLKQSVRAIGSSAYGIAPKSMEIEFLDSARGGESRTFTETIQYWNREISKAVVGQTSSMDGNSGGSYKADSHHRGVRLDIAAHDAAQVVATISRYVVRPFVGFNYGFGTPVPHVRLTVPQPEDLSAWFQAAAVVVDRGYGLASREIDRRLGVTPPVDGEDVLSSAEVPMRVAAAPPAAETPPESDDVTP